MLFKRALVWSLERLCALKDVTPLVIFFPKCTLANLSSDLDIKWSTGVWTEP